MNFDEILLNDNEYEASGNFFTDEIAYINIIYNILNLIYATNPEFINTSNIPSIPLHLLFDRIYYQYSNLFSNSNIDRFIIKQYDAVAEAVEFYLVNYCSFEQLKTDEVDLSFYKQAGEPMNIHTPNLMSKTHDEESGLYIIQHHIGGIRNSQCYITNDLSFKSNDTLKQVSQKNLKRKRFLYVDHLNEVYWMINIDDMMNTNAIISILPLSLIIKENEKLRKVSNNKMTNEMFLTNKVLNFFFYERFQIQSMNNLTLYKYIKENSEFLPNSDDKEDEFFIERILKTGGFNQTYKEIHKLPNQKEQKPPSSDTLSITRSPVNISPALISRSPSSSLGSMVNSNGRSVTFTNKRTISRASTFDNDFPSNYSSIPRHELELSKTTSRYTQEEEEFQSKKSLKKNILLISSPLSKVLIIIVLMQFKKHASNDTKVIISNSWRYIIAGSLFLSILFTFCNLLLLTYTMLEIILSLLDVSLVFVLLFCTLVWIL